MVEVRRRKKGTTYRVKRLEGLLNATFMNKDVAHLQDDLWGRWGAAIPRLADRKPTLPVTLRAELISKETPALTDELLAKLLSYQPAAGVVRSADSSGAVTAGEYIADVFFDVWKNGKMPGGRRREKPEKTWKEMERALNKIVYELEYAYDDDGEKLRDDDGNVVAHWGSAAFAHHVLDEVTAETVFALDQRVSDLGIGLEVWRKVRSFLRQMFAYARLDKDSGFALERANPVDDVPPPAVEKRPRRAYLPDVVEGIRADFYYVAVLSNAGIRRVRGGPRIWTPGDVPIPADPEYALDSADRVEAGAYAGLRPSELFGAHGCAYRRAAPLHLRIDERHVGNDHKSGTKSRSYPEKHVLMLGTLPAMIAERAGSAGADGILFPYPGTDRYFTKDEYKNWRSRYFAPIARARGLGADADDPYSLRHDYSTIRIAAGHPESYINASLGSSLGASTYNTIQRELETLGKVGSYDIDAEIRAARLVELAELEQRLTAVGLQLPVAFRERFVGSVAVTTKRAA